MNDSKKLLVIIFVLMAVDFLLLLILSLMNPLTARHIVVLSLVSVVFVAIVVFVFIYGCRNN